MYKIMRWIDHQGIKLHETLTDDDINGAYISLLVADNTIENHAFHLVDSEGLTYYCDGGGTGFEIKKNIDNLSVHNLTALRDKSVLSCCEGSKLIKKNNEQLEQRLKNV